MVSPKMEDTDEDVDPGHCGGVHPGLQGGDAGHLVLAKDPKDLCDKSGGP